MINYKSKFHLQRINLNQILTNKKHRHVYHKATLINLYMLLDIITIYNGKYFFKKHINVWALGMSAGQFIWTKKRAKYKSKLKLKIKIKVMAQKIKLKKQKLLKTTQKNLYKRFLNILIPKSSLKLIKSNVKLR